MNIIDEYVFVKNIIPEETCKSLIDDCNKRIWEKHKWNNYATGTLESEKTKELDVMPCTKEQQETITPFLIKVLNEYQEKYSTKGEKTSGPWLSKFSPIRFNRYPIGTMMRKHYDHIHSIFDGQMKGVPIISIVANLNNDYEGSKFICRDKEIKLTTGDILLFPSNFMFPHEVTETTKGTRYSFVSWAF